MLFQLKLEILPLPQRIVWNELAAIPPDFYLYGGTAIALHLGHRQSIDFDFFTWSDFAPLEFAASLKLLDGGTILQSEPNTLTVLIDRDGPVKLSFFAVPKLKRIRHAEQTSDTGLKIASLLDLAGTKLGVVQQRAEAKDYIDIDAILTSGMAQLDEALSAAQLIYGPLFSAQNALKALSFFGEPQLDALPDHLKIQLIEQVRRVNLHALPNLEIEV